MPATATDRLFGLTTSVAVKAPCRAVALSNITLSGLQTLNGVTIVEGDRVLVTAQTTASENGIYLASSSSWSRAPDFDGTRDAVQGTQVPVALNGAQTALYEVTSADPITIGSSSINFLLRYSANAQFDISEAEVAANVTPVSYVYAPSPLIDPRRYGFSTTASASTNAAALNSALQVAKFAPGGIVQMPGGEYQINNTLVIASNTILRGSSKGYGVQSGTTLRWVRTVADTHIAIQIGTPGSAVDGFYSGLEDFVLKYDGSNATSSIGIYFSAVHGSFRRLVITGQASVGWGAGIETDIDFGTYALYLTECYISGNTIGFDATRGIDFKLINCYLEANGTNCRIGQVSQVTNFMMIGGENVLFGVGYFGGAAETATSIGMDVKNCLNFEYSGVSSEADGGAIVGSEGQRCIVMRTVRGGKICGHFFGANKATAAITLEASAKGVDIRGAEFINFNGYAIEYTAGAQFDIGINSVSGCTGLWNNTWTPVPTSLTVVNGTGGATYSGTWDRKGDRVFYVILITVTGSATTASTAGTTYFAVDSAMPTPLAVDTNVAVGNGNNASFGAGLSTATSKIYPPTWSAQNQNITISGSYRCAAAS